MVCKLGLDNMADIRRGRAPVSLEGLRNFVATPTGGYSKNCNIPPPRPLSRTYKLGTSGRYVLKTLVYSQTRIDGGK